MNYCEFFITRYFRSRSIASRTYGLYLYWSQASFYVEIMKYFMLFKEYFVCFLLPLSFVGFILFLGDLFRDFVWLITEKCAEANQLGIKLWNPDYFLPLPTIFPTSIYMIRLSYILHDLAYIYFFILIENVIFLFQLPCDSSYHWPETKSYAHRCFCYSSSVKTVLRTI